MHQIHINGQILSSSFKLNEDQDLALRELVKFLTVPVIAENEETYLMTLVGSAGTGKTSLLKLLIQYNNKLGPNKLNIAGAALTHKARKVLDHTVNKNMLMKMRTFTVASLLKKQKQAGYVGTKNFRGTGSILNEVNMVLIDEVSMIADRDYVELIKWAEIFRTKILFIGDSAQIPHPIQELLIYDGKLEKRDSLAFKLKNTVVLNQVMRQGESNPLADIYLNLRKGLREEKPYERVTKYNINETGEVSGVEFVDSAVDFADRISKYYKRAPILSELSYLPRDHKGDVLCTSEYRNAKHSILSELSYYDGKIICYTNNSVKQYNDLVRTLRNDDGKGDVFQIGDLLMGYENMGFPEQFIENGQEYEIVQVGHVNDHYILLDVCSGSSMSDKNQLQLGPAEGYMLVIVELNRGADTEIIKGKKSTIFVPDIYSEKNYPILQELIRRADKVNMPGSSKEDFKKYAVIKEQLVFLEALYKWEGEIFGEKDFIKRHPLLRTRITDLIKEEVILNANTKAVVGAKRSLKENEIIKEIEAKYPGMIMARLRDVNTLGDSEELKDCFQILSKDIDYGYAITAHKSQGSTYKYVFLDEHDFDKIGDRWNYRHNMMQRGSKERNQLKYVAFTRASCMVTVL